MNKEIVLGLDIGIGSIGWGLIDKQTGEIIDKGVRLFSEANPENNVDRRLFRSTRRSIRRKEFRLYRTRRVLLEMGLIDDIAFLPLDNPYEIRCKGLENKLRNDELATAILHLMKRNGFRYEIVDDKESSGVSRISDEYLCQHQLKILQAYGKVRGQENRYHFKLYEKEFKKLLEIQNIDSSFQERLLDIFTRRRHYAEGPGCKTSPSAYGRYLSFNSQPINLIEKMRGHCSVFQDELRAPKVCPSAELFNFLSDINNITIHGNHIPVDKKVDMIETFILGKNKITIKQLENFLGESLANMDGLRVNASGEPLITEFKSLKKIKDAIKKADLSDYPINSIEDFYILDDIFEILTQEKTIEGREERLNKLSIPELSNEHLKCFAKIKETTGYHSLSLKALREINSEMLQTSKNAQQIIVTLRNNNEQFDQGLRLPENTIMSPVVRKALNQTFLIVKAIIKKYGHLHSIILEMAREKNSGDLKKKISETQKRRVQEKEKVLALLEGLNIQEIKGDLIEKILLYIEQDSKSIYSGKPMNLNEIINDPSAYEIDHIIPYSLSLDDSRSNKVLVYSHENQNKGRRTPFQVFQNKPADWWTWTEFEAFSRYQYIKNRSKLSKLLEKRDIESYDVQEEFISRNLNDTRYICKQALLTLKMYFSHHDIDTKVHVVNGLLTNRVRRIANLKKDRNFHCHHAIDALIIASFLKSKYLESGLNNELIDYDTGEIFTNNCDDDIFGPVVENVVKQLISLDQIDDFRFSYKVDAKANRSLFDSTLYGTRLEKNDLYVIKKYANIYDKPGEKLAENIRKNKDIENLLIYRNDKNTFVLLQKIVASYPNEKNPFSAYKNEHGDYVRKVSKKGKNAPAVISIRYVEDKANISLPLSNKYPKPVAGRGYPIKLQLSPYRMDLYLNEDDGKYRFLTIRYSDVRQKGNEYIINEAWYEKEKERYGIGSNFHFVNSFYRCDLIKRTFRDGTTKLDVFKVVNDQLSQRIEIDSFGQNIIDYSNGVPKKKQVTISIGRNVSIVQKYGTDILGNLYLIRNEPLKLRWQ